MRPLLDVALERVTRAVFPFCVPAASVLAGLAVVTVLEGAVVVEALPVAVLLDGVAAVLREVLVVEVPVFTCLLAGVPLEAELLELVLLLTVEPVFLEVVDVLPVERRTWLEEVLAGVLVLRDTELEVLLEAELEEVLLAGAAVVAGRWGVLLQRRFPKRTSVLSM